MSAYFNSVQRIARLEQVAASWVGTPFMPNAAVKGAGVSCQKLVTAIFKECGALPADWKCDNGPMNWATAQKKSLIEEFMAKQSKYFELIVGKANLRPGDMLGFKIDGCVHHCGVLLDNAKFIHCWRCSGVIIGQIMDASFYTRLEKIWRPIQ